MNRDTGRSTTRRRTARSSDSYDEGHRLHSPPHAARRSQGRLAQTMTTGRRRKGHANKPSRLSFLLSILLVTTLMLVMLQAYRQIYRTRRSSARSPLRSRVGLAYDRLRGLRPSTQSKSIPSGVASASDREVRLEGEENPLSWTKYISAMRQHFRDTLDENAIKKQNDDSDGSLGRSGGGIAIVPGENVKDHEVAGDVDPPPSVPGKSREEALEDRRAALEELDQETLKAMLDALYGRGA